MCLCVCDLYCYNICLRYLQLVKASRIRTLLVKTKLSVTYVRTYLCMYVCIHVRESLFCACTHACMRVCEIYLHTHWHLAYMQTCIEQISHGLSRVNWVICLYILLLYINIRLFLIAYFTLISHFIIVFVVVVVVKLSTKQTNHLRNVETPGLVELLTHLAIVGFIYQQQHLCLIRYIVNIASLFYVSTHCITGNKTIANDS